MAKIAPIYSGGLALRLQRQHKIASAATNVEHSRPWFPQHVRNSRHCARPPPAVDIHREQVIQQIVARRNASEHSPHPSSGLPFVLNSGRRRTRRPHDNGSLITASTTCS